MCDRFATLVAPYCAIPRDYLSDTPHCALWGFWCQLGAIPPPHFLSIPPWRACKVEVRDSPHKKGVSQRYLPRDTLCKQGKKGVTPPSAIRSRKGIAQYGRGISHWAAKFATTSNILPLMCDKTCTQFLRKLIEFLGSGIPSHPRMVSIQGWFLAGPIIQEWKNWPGPV